MKKQLLSLFVGLVVLQVAIPRVVLGQDSTAKSEWVQVKKTDIPADLLKYLDNEGYVRYQNPYIQPDRISDFMKNVVYFADVTDVTLSKITDNTNKFAKTEMGTFAMVLIAYNVAGEEFLSFAKRLLSLIVFLSLYVIWWRKRMLPQSVFDSVGEGGIRNYEVYVPILWVQALWLVLFFILSFIII